ncbi:MAG TPA: O-antigen ligase family protein [Solirubrobacterales bacterium]|nr:O-antigen ligase family protein [Solirubrobacterales bacterium]
MSMSITNRTRGLVPLAVAGILAGALAPLLPPAGLLVVVAVLGLGLATALIRFRAGAGEQRAWHPVLMLLTGAAVITVSWNGFRSGGTSPPDLLLLAGLFGVGYCWFQDTIRVPIPGWLVGAAVILLVSQLLNQFFFVPTPPQDPPPSFTPPGPALLTLARFELAFLIVPILIGAVASSWKRVNLIANLWLLSATISAAIGTIDGFTGAGLGASFTGVDVGGRAAGLAIHPNTFALTCSMAMPLALLRAAQLRGWGRAAGIAASGLLATGILVSGSRVGLVSLVLAVGLTAMLIPKLRSRIVVVGLTGVVLTVLIAPQGNPLTEGFDRLAGGGSASQATGQRSDQFHESLTIALHHPVTGVGFTVVADAHTLPLQFWETAGFLGVAALILYATGVFRTGLRLYRDRRLPRGSPALAGALTISFAVWLIAGLLENEIADRYIYVPVGLLLGLGLAASAGTRGPDRSEPAPTPRPAEPPAPVPQRVERVPLAGARG